MSTRFPAFPLLRCAAALVLAACASSSPSSSDGYYRVQRGDTLNRIAARFGQSPATLAKWNNLGDPSKIAVGQRLRVGRNAPAAAPHKPAERGSGSTLAPSNKLRFAPPTPNLAIARFGGGNKGIDFAGQSGDPVRAAAGGRVAYVGDGVRGYGNLVLIAHGNGVITAYAHNSRILVKKGQTVRTGDTVAAMGSSDADRVKLHFEVRISGKAVNPEPYLPPLKAASPVPFPAVPAASAPAAANPPAAPTVQPAPPAAVGTPAAPAVQAAPPMQNMPPEEAASAAAPVQ